MNNKNIEKQHMERYNYLFKVIGTALLHANATPPESLFAISIMADVLTQIRIQDPEFFLASDLKTVLGAYWEDGVVPICSGQECASSETRRVRRMLVNANNKLDITKKFIEQVYKRTILGNSVIDSQLSEEAKNILWESFGINVNNQPPKEEENNNENKSDE
jgi:hypothetical protein